MNAVSPRVVRGRLLDFTIVEHTSRYDVVTGHAHRFTLRHDARRINLGELGLCVVVGRTEHAVVLRSPVLPPVALADAHDIVYEGVDFEGRGSGLGAVSGVVFIEGASHDLTFKDCVIGTNQDGVGNGVKIVDTGRGMHDITFDHCTFKYQPKMGFECIRRANPGEGGTGGPGYQRVNVVDCTFAASAGEAISYDDDYGAVMPAGHCNVSRNWVDGAGVGSSYAYGSVIENNGVHDMAWTDNYFGAGRDSIVNISGRGGGPLDMVCSGNVYDGLHVPAGVSLHNQCVTIHDASGVRFDDTIINNPYGYSRVWAYLNNCSDLDFGSSVVRNITGAPSAVYGSGNTNIVWPTVESRPASAARATKVGARPWAGRESRETGEDDVGGGVRLPPASARQAGQAVVRSCSVRVAEAAVVAPASADSGSFQTATAAAIAAATSTAFRTTTTATGPDSRATMRQ